MKSMLLTIFNQGPQRIRLWIEAHPGKLRREGEGKATRYFVA
jgi:hypothetical protein